ncbi:response regulator transcription factor [Saccharopolyspora sp. K220]|uniref:response regulator transcription factor n=1 Tax=Saccharopolyspora soli TaxID=2926618 RepID=UPI001F59091E|nr:response regulator transcription factor [Saccharopolyspora soli]MCI2421673.1 response regulator transcription factor [Saccharopolyspora soli]
MSVRTLASIAADMASTNPSKRIEGAIDFVRAEGRCDTFLVAYKDAATDAFVRIAERGYGEAAASFLTGDIEFRPEFERQFNRFDYVFDWTEVPDFETSYTARSVLRPAGFNNGIMMLLHDDNGEIIGMCHGNVEHREFPRVGKELIEKMRPVFTSYARDQRRKAHFRLTPREVQILDLIRKGMSNAEIAEFLVLSPRTVSRHVENVLHKLGVPNRVMAAVYATELGFGSHERTVDGIACPA